MLYMEEGNLFPGSLDRRCTKPDLHLSLQLFPSSNVCSTLRRRPSQIPLHRLRRCITLASLSDAVLVMALFTLLCALACQTDMVIRPCTLARRAEYHPSVRRHGDNGKHEARVSQPAKPVPISASASEMASNIETSVFEVAEGRRLQEQSRRSCRTLSDEDRRTVWVMERQTVYSGRRSISNTAEVVKAVRRTLHRAGLADAVRVRVMHPSLNMQCTAVQRNDGSEATESERDFKDVSMLIAVAGAALDNVSYLPKGSSVVEVLPFDVRGNDERQAVAKSVGVHFHQMWNARDKRLERRMRMRFGDAAKTAESCWMSAECKAARLRAPTKVDVHHLKMLLHTVFKEWRQSCVV